MVLLDPRRRVHLGIERLDFDSGTLGVWDARAIGFLGPCLRDASLRDTPEADPPTIAPPPTAEEGAYEEHSPPEERENELSGLDPFMVAPAAGYGACEDEDDERARRS